MKIPSLVVALFSSACLTAAAADFNGAWRVDVARRGDVTLHTYFIIKQTGDTLDGTVVINGAVDLPMRRAHMEGDDALFSVDWNTDYRVQRDGDRLKVAITYGGHGGENAIAVRVPESEARPPAAIPLPALERVPSNHLAPTPPMGWNSWNHFGDRVDDKIVRAAADVLVSSGLAAAGYQYVNIDDCWESHRDAKGRIVPNSKFPDMKALADYVHSRGLKLGLYSSPGPLTCGGYEGSYGHEEQDANTYAAWGIDYLKHDWCSAARVYSEADVQAAYQKMGLALSRSGRPIVYSLCEYGMREVWKWGPDVGANLWRTTGDIQDNWKSMTEIGFSQSDHAPYAAPGHWNDPDMLEVGNGGMTAIEYRTHFSLWCLLAAPLMAGNDLSTMTAETLEILSNREVIAIDQDALGRQGQRVSAHDGIEVWSKPLEDGGVAVGIFNRNETETKTAFTWTQLGRETSPTTARDLWLHREVPVTGEGFSASIPAHGTVLLRLN